MAMLVSACSKDDVQNFYLSPDPVYKNGSGNPSVAFIEVYPGEDLAAACEQAKASGKGSIVKLMEGTYEIGVTEVRDFFGTITGEGPGKTVITNRPDISAEEIMFPGRLPSFITFIGGEVTISDLSVKLSFTDCLGKFELHMLLFSDYSPDYMPARQYIKVHLDNIEVKGLRIPPAMLYPFPVRGVKCSPDIMRDSPGIFPRSNIDLQVSYCTFSDLGQGIYVWGCKKGNLDIGNKGGNLFDGNGKGLLINENLGMHAVVENNIFNIPARHYNGIDLNTGEEALNVSVPLEVIQADAGIYRIHNNTFNVSGPANAIGLMDAWRLAHPEYPVYMKMIWQDNKFVLNNQGSFIGWTYCLKNMLFEKNIITGNDVAYSRLMATNLYWMPDLPNNTSEGCRFINNHFMRKNFIFYMDVNVNNYLVMGDLTDVIIQNYGENNKIIGKTNPNHANGTFKLEMYQTKMQAGDLY
jgi:hypothetical protein